MPGMLDSRRRAISRSVSMSLRANWRHVKPCPQCQIRRYGNYAGTVCKKCQEAAK